MYSAEACSPRRIHRENLGGDQKQVSNCLELIRNLSFTVTDVKSSNMFKKKKSKERNRAGEGEPELPAYFLVFI